MKYLKLNTITYWLGRIFIGDKNYEEKDQDRLQRYFTLTAQGPMYYNHLDIKALEAFAAGKAKFNARPLREADIEWIDNPEQSIDVAQQETPAHS